MSSERLTPIPDNDEIPDSEIQFHLRQVWQEIEHEAYQDQPVGLNRCRIINFISTSGGRGKKRQPREIIFLVVDGNHAYQIKNGEIKSRKKSDHYVDPDVLINEVLNHLPLEERTSDKLIELVERIDY